MLLEDGGEGDKGKYEGKEGALVFKGAPSLLGALCRIDGSNSDETTYLSIMDLLVDRQGDVNGKAVEKAGEEGGKGGEKKGEEGEKKKSLGARVGARMTKSKLPKEGAEGADGGAGELPVVNRGGGYKEFTCVQEAVVSGNLFCLQWLLKKGFYLFDWFIYLCLLVLMFLNLMTLKNDTLLPRCFFELTRRNGIFSCYS